MGDHMNTLDSPSGPCQLGGYEGRLGAASGTVGKLSRNGFWEKTEGIWRAWFLSVGKLRRFYLVHFRKAYVRGKLASREGECRQCGRCCSFLFRCPMLGRDGLCRVYNGARWLACKMFPVDERDLRDVTISGGCCGYKWDEGSRFVPARWWVSFLSLRRKPGARNHHNALTPFRKPW